MIVVLDTNIWLAELVLSSGVGSAFRFHMKQRNAGLAVPEVVRLEVQTNLRRTIADTMEQVAHGDRQLRALFGSTREIILPSQDEVDDLVAGVFTSLGLTVHEIPFSLESARSAFMKTIERLPPSDRSQEFKDGVLWADCLRILDQDDVLIVSRDKAFFEDRDFGKGLAKTLCSEATGRRGKVSLVHTLADVLTHIEVDLDLDGLWLVSVLRKAHTGVRKLLERTDSDEAGAGVLRYDLYATENPDAVYLTYTIDIPCTDREDSGRSNMSLSLRGNAMLQPSGPGVSRQQITEEALTYSQADGAEGRLANVYAYAVGLLGHRTIEHSVRYPLKRSGDS